MVPVARGTISPVLLPASARGEAFSSPAVPLFGRLGVRGEARRGRASRAVPRVEATVQRLPPGVDPRGIGQVQHEARVRHRPQPGRIKRESAECQKRAADFVLDFGLFCFAWGIVSACIGTEGMCESSIPRRIHAEHSYYTVCTHIPFF